MVIETYKKRNEKGNKVEKKSSPVLKEKQSYETKIDVEVVKTIKKGERPPPPLSNYDILTNNMHNGSYKTLRTGF